ncbi:MAG: insulinase family protein [Calditrichaeota bacterium]|nr:MAG: insulinase family protein [Calditrichota bacterium]
MRKLSLMALLFLFAGLSNVPAGDKLSAPYTRFTLPNGLTVIVHEDHTVPRVSVNIWYHVGSGSEKVGRTGFAHLFEHILFEGSGHVPEGKFDQWLEAAGANNNGSTTNDRTNYYEDLPSNALELALFLESDRMGYLIEAMSPEKVDGQRDVVKNEKRQRVDNQPYGRAWELLSKNLYPAEHPYSWSVIGSMEDLSAASYDDVVEFFNNYYTPSNAALVIAGDVNTDEARKLTEKWFSDVPNRATAPPVDPVPAVLSEEKRIVLEDKVQLPRLYMAWLSPARFQPGDAEFDLLTSVLTEGKNSRLYKRLVYELQIAQSVNSYNGSNKLSGEFYIIATARAGHTLAELEKVIQEELDKIKNEVPSDRELQRALNQYEADFYRGLEKSGGFGGKANQLNTYFYYTGNPDYFNEDLARYQAISPNDLSAIANTYLNDDARVILSIVPEGKTELAGEKGGVK